MALEEQQRPFKEELLCVICRRQTYLPVELMAQAGVSQEGLYRGQHSDGLADVVFQVASLAKVSEIWQAHQLGCLWC